MEEKSLENGEARVKFETIRLDSNHLPTKDEWKPLSKALQVSEKLGAAPVCADGRVAGNGAILSPDGNSIVVSRTGRYANTKYSSSQFVRVVEFDQTTWTSKFHCEDENAQPTSDTPLLWFGLKVAPQLFNWTSQPRFILHGHSCSTEEEAQQLGIPCSPVETLFSTPDDLNALKELLQQYPYPENKIFVRKNHGFFLLADSKQEALSLFTNKLMAEKKCSQIFSLSKGEAIQDNSNTKTLDQVDDAASTTTSSFSCFSYLFQKKKHT